MKKRQVADKRIINKFGNKIIVAISAQQTEAIIKICA